ncbi:MAG: aldo/keto reductase [Pseudomonadota bacterium]
MERRRLGNEFTVSALGLGCMGMSEFYGPRNDNESLSVLGRAIDLGIDFFDTADIYGPYHNEELLGRFLREHKPDVRIATKFGIVRKPGAYERTIDNAPDYARRCCEASLTRLGIERIDLYYVHRIEAGRPIEDVMGALAELVSAGKIAHIGLCEVSAETLRRAHAVYPVTAVQTEYSLWTRDVENTVLPVCRELGIGFVPYSPLGRGFLTGTFQTDTTFADDDFRAVLPRFSEDNLARNQALVDIVRQKAAERRCTPAQVALAWLLNKGDDIVPIPGTKRIRYLEDNAGAVGLTFDPEEMAAFDAAIARAPVVGERYTAEGMKGVDA